MTEQEKSVSNLELSEKPENGANGYGESGLAIRSDSQTVSLATGELEVIGTIMNNRPVEASHLRVLDYAYGHRPIFASEIVVRDDLTLPGGRPIVVSDPSLMQASHIIGGRPIASNDSNEGETLMGFLD